MSDLALSTQVSTQAAAAYPVGPMLKYLFQNQHFCTPFVMLKVSSFSLASPWMMALYSSLALIKPELSLSASFPGKLQTTAFQTIVRSAACFDVKTALLSRSRELSRHPSSIPNPPPARRDKSGSQFIKSKVKHSNC